MNKTCPFCKSTLVAAERVNDTRWGHAVCYSCGASGPEVRAPYGDEGWKVKSVVEFCLK